MSVHVLFPKSHFLKGHAVAQLVEALRYKPEGRGFDSVCFETRRRKVAATSCRTVSVASVACIEVEWCSVVVFTNIGEVNLGESFRQSE